jgi:hypothetical protein
MLPSGQTYSIHLKLDCVKPSDVSRFNSGQRLAAIENGFRLIPVHSDFEKTICSKGQSILFDGAIIFENTKDGWFFRRLEPDSLKQ